MELSLKTSNLVIVAPFREKNEELALYDLFGLVIVEDDINVLNVFIMISCSIVELQFLRLFEGARD